MKIELTTIELLALLDAALYVRDAARVEDDHAALLTAITKLRATLAT